MMTELGEQSILLYKMIDEKRWPEYSFVGSVVLQDNSE